MQSLQHAAQGLADDRARRVDAACNATTAATRPSPRRTPAPTAAAWRCSRRALGTERIEEALLSEKFPDVPVLRIDRGTTQRRDALEQAPGEVLGDRARDPGRHPDAGQGPRPAEPHAGRGSRASTRACSAPTSARREKLAQLLIQVAGRAGRADRPGEVLAADPPSGPSAARIRCSPAAIGAFAAEPNCSSARRRGFRRIAHSGAAARGGEAGGTGERVPAAGESLFRRRVERGRRIGTRAGNPGPATRPHAQTRRHAPHPAAPVRTESSRTARAPRRRIARFVRTARSAQSALVA